MASKLQTGVLLAAHGDGARSAANRAVHDLARALELAGAADRVVAGFHRGAPSFGDAVARLDVDQVIVVPFMASAGYYATVVLPRALAAASGADRRSVTITEPVGAHPAITTLAARSVSRLIERHRLDPAETTVVIVGHGTTRSAGSRHTTAGLAESLSRASLVERVRVAFLDADPLVEAVMATIDSGPIIVIPFLVGGGTHTRDDLPRRLGIGVSTPDRDTRLANRAGHPVILGSPIGAHPALLGIVAEMIQVAAHTPEGISNGHSPKGVAGIPGCVYLVGAGPGHPDLVTVAGRRLIEAADVIVADRLAAPELVALAPADAEIIDVGKRAGDGSSQHAINEILVDRARAGGVVVRLKGGDPFVFGRGAEEIDACRRAGVTTAVVPGVTSAVAVPAAAGIPITDRRAAASFAVVTPIGAGGEPIDLAPFAAIETLVVLMGRERLGAITTALIEAGRDPKTAAAAIQDGTTERQRVVTGTLATIPEDVVAAELRAPVVLVIGAVAARAATGGDVDWHALAAEVG